MNVSLIIPAFIAGILTFFAPCTLPLVPGYLGFIAGAQVQNLRDIQQVRHIRKKVFFNGLFYVLGFSAVFVLLGSVFAGLGTVVAPYRYVLTKIGGICIIFFGLHLMQIFHSKWFSFLLQEKKFHIIHRLTPGKPLSACIFGVTFAFGWTPCVGPILGTILTLATTTDSLLQGSILLSIFSFGLAIPFLLLALGVGHATQTIQKINKYLHSISFVGGLFLVFLGVLLLFGKTAVWFSWVYEVFDFMEYDRLLQYL